MPFAFYEAVVQRVISLIQVDPETHAFGHPFPIVDVGYDRLATQPGKLSNANLLLDLGFIVVFDQTLAFEMFFHFVLDGKAMRVPAGFPRDMKTAHGFVAGIDVLEATSQNVMNTGFSIRGRRTLIKCEQRSALAGFERFGKYILLPPEIQDLRLDRRSVIPALDFTETHKHFHAPLVDTLHLATSVHPQKNKPRAHDLRPGRRIHSRYHPVHRRYYPLPRSCPSRGPAGQAYSATLFGRRLRGDIQQDSLRGLHRPPVS